MEQQRTAQIAWRNIVLLVVLAAVLVVIYGVTGTAGTRCAPGSRPERGGVRAISSGGLTGDRAVGAKVMERVVTIPS